MEPFPLPSTLFFPVSGNPIGFNHFAAAEWMLRAEPELERVVFVLSNGRHPDPTKPDAEVGPELRLELLRQSAAEIADPEASFLAARARSAGETLRSGRPTLAISTLEFDYDRAVRTAEAVRHLLQGREPGPLHLLVGADLIRRMGDPRIFSAPDLDYLARHCRYLILEREGNPAAEAVRQLTQARGVSLDHLPLAAAEAPGWLAPFLQLSSTCIRHAAEAGDPLGGMVTRSAAALIEAHALYGSGGRGGPASTLTTQLQRLERELLTAGARLGGLLRGRREAGLPHKLAVVESSAGGAVTLALAAHSGASAWFSQSRFAYDRIAKATLIGDRADSLSSVSAEMAGALATALREAAGTDFALAESGMAGPPDGRRHSLKNGQTWFALAGPERVQTRHIALNPFLTRREHQLRFAAEALAWARELLA